MKPGKGYKENKEYKKVKQDAQELVEKGDAFGDSIIGQEKCLSWKI